MVPDEQYLERGMKRRELLKLVPVVAFAAALPAIANCKKQTIYRTDISKPVRLIRVTWDGYETITVRGVDHNFNLIEETYKIPA